MSETVTENETIENEPLPEMVDGEDVDTGNEDEGSISDLKKEMGIEFELPRHTEDIERLFPKTWANTPSVVGPLLVEMMKAFGEIGNLNATLSAQNDNLTDEDIVTLASSRNEPNVVKAYKALERIRQQMNEAIANVVKEMEPILSEGQLSEDEKKEVQNKRKAQVELFVNYKGTIPTLPHFIAEDEKDHIAYVMENLVAPGMRKTSGSVKSANAGGGMSKPRLNKGKVHVNGKQFETVSKAANYIRTIVNGPFDQNSLVEAWCHAAGTVDWKDIPYGVQTFNVQPGVEVSIEKLPAPTESAKPVSTGTEKDSE